MPTLLDLSPADLDNPLAPHVIRRHQEQNAQIAQQQEAQRRALALQGEQRQSEVQQAAQPGVLAQTQQDTQRSTMLPMATSDFMSYMLPQTYHKEGAAPDSPYETGNPYRVPFAQAPQEAKQHAIDAYGINAPQFWNDTAKQMGGGVNRALPLVMAKAGIKDDPSYTDEERQQLIAGHAQELYEGKGDKITAGTQKEFEDRRLPTLDEEGKPLTESAAVQRLQDYDKGHGRMSDADSQVYNQELQRYTAGKEYTNAYTSANAMSNFKSTFEDAKKNPNTANNLAVIDNFIRTQNPGATVRAQTLTMVKNGQALLQKLTPEYLEGHYEEGQMLTKQFVEQAAKVIEDEAKAQNRLFKRTYLNGIHSALEKRGLPADDFKSPYDSVLEEKDEAQPTASATPSGPQPDISEDAYKALPSGAKFWYGGQELTKQ